MENRHGLCVSLEVTSATDVSETGAAKELLAQRVDVQEGRAAQRGRGQMLP